MKKLLTILVLSMFSVFSAGYTYAAPKKDHVKVEKKVEKKVKKAKKK